MSVNDQSTADFLTVSNVASKCGVSERTVYSWTRSRQLRSYRLGTPGKRGHIGIKPADLAAFLETLVDEAPPDVPAKVQRQPVISRDAGEAFARDMERVKRKFPRGLR